MLGRCHTLCPSGNLDGIGIDHANSLQELTKSQLEAIVEAPQDGGIAVVFFVWSIEVEHLLHKLLLGENRSRKSSYLRNPGDYGAVNRFERPIVFVAAALPRATWAR